MAVAVRGEAARECGATVVVGDGDAAVRSLAGRLLGSVGFDVRVAKTGAEALELARTVRPAAVLLDVALTEISGYQVCHVLRGEYGPELPILLLSTDRTEPYDKAAGLLLGADDYIAKPFAPGELLARVEARTRAGTARSNGSTATTLTPSELRVLRLLADGSSTKGIARELSIAPKTVAMHVHNAMKKLNVHSRTQAVALAHKLGLVNGYAGIAGPPAEVTAHALGRPRRGKSAARPVPA